jgi:hypothetical protein
VADDIVAREVTDPWQEICDLRDEIERLRRWKNEASAVIAEWEAVFDALIDISATDLGASKPTLVAKEIIRLRAENSMLRQNEWRLIWGLCTECGKNRNKEANRG